MRILKLKEIMLLRHQSGPTWIVGILSGLLFQSSPCLATVWPVSGIEITIDIITVKEILGYSSVRVTERYTHCSFPQKESAVRAL